MAVNYKVLCIKNYEFPENWSPYGFYIGFYEGEIYDAEVDDNESSSDIKWTIISDIKEEAYFNDEELVQYFKIAVKETRKEKIKNINAKGNMQ